MAEKQNLMRNAVRPPVSLCPNCLVPLHLPRSKIESLQVTSTTLKVLLMIALNTSACMKGSPETAEQR